MALPLVGYIGDLWMSVSPSVALSAAESCTDTGDEIHYNASVHNAWDWNYTLTVQNCPTSAPVNTQNTAAITAGTVTVTPVTGTLMNYIVIGSKLSIAAGGGTAEVVTVTGTTGSTFTAVFAYNHAANTAITTVWTTVTDYTFIYPRGQVVFNTARVLGQNNFTQINAGNYFSVTQLDGSFSWQLSLKCNTEKTTQFQAPLGFEQNTPTISGGTVKTKTYRTDNRVLLELTGNNLVVLQLFTDKGNNKRWVGYALIDSIDSPTDAVKVMQQNPSFTLIGPPYFLTS